MMEQTFQNIELITLITICVTCVVAILSGYLYSNRVSTHPKERVPSLKGLIH